MTGADVVRDVLETNRRCAEAIAARLLSERDRALDERDAARAEIRDYERTLARLRGLNSALSIENRRLRDRLAESPAPAALYAAPCR